MNGRRRRLDARQPSRRATGASASEVSMLTSMNSRGEAERRIYSRPPIQEVLIQVAVAEGALSNAAVPGQLYERVRGEYPSDITTEVRLQVPTAAAALVSGEVQVNRAARHVFSGLEPNKKLILGGDRMSVNALPPYEGWEQLLERFNRAAEALFAARPELQADSLTIRYINRVIVPEPPINTDDYFTVPVRTAEEGTASFAAFSLRVQSILTEDPITCTTSFSSIEAAEGRDGVDFVIDIELDRPTSDLDRRTPSAWVAALEDLHIRENREFESMITDHCRGLFE